MTSIVELVSESDEIAEIISAIRTMVEKDFAREERSKFQEARTRYIQIRMSEASSTTDEPQPENGGESVAEDSVFYSTSPSHIFRETTV